MHRTTAIPGLGTFSDHSYHTPLPDASPVLQARLNADSTCEAAFPLAQGRAAQRFAAWRTDPAMRPAFEIPRATGPVALAAALACPDLFLLDTPLGPDRLNAIVALVEATGIAGQRLAILTSHPDNANAIVLALPAAGVGRAKADAEAELPMVVAEQTAKALALGEWRARRSALLFQKQETVKALNWWTEWDRLAQMESPPESMIEPEGLASLDAELAATLESLHAAERTETETKKTLEVQLAQSRPPAESAGGLGGFVKKLFGGAKVDPQLAAIDAKLKDLDAAAVHRNRAIAEAGEHHRLSRSRILAEERARIDSISAEQSARLASRRESWNVSRPPADRSQLELALSDLESKIAESEFPPLSPHREAMQRLTVVVGPLAALDSDPFFAPTHPEAEPSFDRVVFADAEDLDEVDFIRAARLAHRWTMLGSSDFPKPVYRNSKPGRGDFFRGAYEATRATPWRTENGRFVAILVAGETRELRVEPLADDPGIQLRFRDELHGETELAEVAFPPEFTLIDAKRFVYCELGFPVAQFLGRPEWSETAVDVQCSWPGVGAAFELESGIREFLADGFTTRFQFAMATGWTRESAEAWFVEHFAHQPAPRAARLCC